MKYGLIAVMIVLLLSLVGGAYYVISNMDRLVADAIEFYALPGDRDGGEGWRRRHFPG
ncbi:MAG: hypothetical protein U5O39_12585 [Gammaproteobacteria bacterium]|nr:hypothetical protein [Gammaproteobacteria bacterium]